MNQQANKPDQGPMNATAILVVGIAILAVIGFQKVKPSILALWTRHHAQVVAIAAFASLLTIVCIVALLWNRLADHLDDKGVTAKDPTAVLLGTDEQGILRWLKQSYRTLHAHVLGTTSAGKTESVILPWIIQDIENGSGILIIDGKSDRSTLDKVYAYVVKNKREKDFRLFSLGLLDPSSSFNPLVGGTAYEVAERVFSSFPIESSYYRAIQFKIFQSLLSLIHEARQVPTFALVHRLLTDREELTHWLKYAKNPTTRRVLTGLLNLEDGKWQEQVSGLEANLSHFVQSDPGILFNQERSDIQFDEVLKNNLICYFQLPTLIYPFLGAATGKLVLQCFEAAIGKTQVGLTRKGAFFSCFLDDFQDYIYPGFSSVLNKSRSAGIGVVFSHQSLGNLDKVGGYFREEVTSCTNVKIFMRTNDPDSAEYCAKTIGTRDTTKVTERQQKGLLGPSKTGEGSVREVKEYIYHPDEIKRLKLGEAIVQIPYEKGVKNFKIRFPIRLDLPAVALPDIRKEPVEMESFLPLPPNGPKKGV